MQGIPGKGAKYLDLERRRVVELAQMGADLANPGGGAMKPGMKS